MDRLLEYAASIGVSVAFIDGLDPHHPGRFSQARRHIDVLDGMMRIKTECALAHELGHATLMHEPTIFAHVAAKQERAADAWAAHFLIDNTEYQYAEQKYGTRTDWIAQELGVLQRLVDAYECTLTKLGDTVYVGAQLGSCRGRFESVA